MSLVTRAAARNVLPSSHVILEQVGAAHAQNPTAAIIPNLDEELLAHILRLPREEIARRRHPARADEGYVDFFGSAVRADEIAFRRRRFAPAAVGASAHIRALWSIKTIPCCTETWQYLTDTCHACGAVQGWRNAWRLDRCDRCGTRLDRAEAQEVDLPLRESLGFLIGLLDPDPNRRLRARAELPDTLADWDGGMVLELGLALMTLTRDPYQPKRKNAVPAADRAAYATALAQAAMLVRGWPATLIPALERAVVARSRSRQNVRYTGVPGHLPALTSEMLPELVRAAIMNALAPIMAAPGKTPAGQIGMMEAVYLIRRPIRDLAPARREGRLRTRICLRANRILPTLDRAEVEYIGDFLKNRISAEGASHRFDLPAYAVTLIADARHISIENHPFLVTRYRNPQLHKAELDRFKASLRDAALKPAARGDQAPTRSIDDPIPLHRAARAIGGGFKPWGTIIDHLLSRAAPFTMSDARASRIQISARDAHSLHSLDLSLTTPSTLLLTCSQRDALEILNLPGKHSHLLKQFAEADDQWEMDWDVVLRLARTRITLTELSATSGIRATKLEILLDEEGCPRADPLGWWREEALDALRRVAAVTAAPPR